MITEYTVFQPWFSLRVGPRSPLNLLSRFRKKYGTHAFESLHMNYKTALTELAAKRIVAKNSFLFWRECLFFEFFYQE